MLSAEEGTRVDQSVNLRQMPRRKPRRPTCLFDATQSLSDAERLFEDDHQRDKATVDVEATRRWQVLLRYLCRAVAALLLDILALSLLDDWLPGLKEKHSNTGTKAGHGTESLLPENLVTRLSRLHWSVDFY